MTDLAIARSAAFSECGKYRYTLHRVWDAEGPQSAFVCLNPSTADETQDDPTVRRCIQYAMSWGYGGLVMLNLFAFRATDVRVMKMQFDPVGPYNDEAIIDAAGGCNLVVAAWGNHGNFRGRDKEASDLWAEPDVYGLDDLHCLALNKSRQPAHPLYQRADLKPVKFSFA